MIATRTAAGPAPTNTSLGEAFARVVDSVRAMLWHFTASNAPFTALFMLTSKRLSRLAKRLDRLYAQWLAGTLPPPRPARLAQTRKQHERHTAPQRQAWLRAVLSRIAPNAIPVFTPQLCLYADQMLTILTNPTYQNFLAEVPRAGRLLRPLCRMVGVTPIPAAIRPPPRKRHPKPTRPAPTDPALPFHPREAALPEPSATPPELPPLRWRGYEIPKGRKKPPGYPKRRLLPFE